MLHPEIDFFSITTLFRLDLNDVDALIWERRKINKGKSIFT
jgi:hypothetical protein